MRVDIIGVRKDGTQGVLQVIKVEDARKYGFIRVYVSADELHPSKEYKITLQEHKKTLALP